jgi:hypothetical protein
MSELQGNSEHMLIPRINFAAEKCFTHILFSLTPWMAVYIFYRPFFPKSLYRSTYYTIARGVIMSDHVQPLNKCMVEIGCDTWDPSIVYIGDYSLPTQRFCELYAALAEGKESLEIMVASDSGDEVTWAVKPCYQEGTISIGPYEYTLDEFCGYAADVFVAKPWGWPTTEGGRRSPPFYLMSCMERVVRKALLPRP